MKGAIFDLDGTLIDSMWVWAKIDDELLYSFGEKPDSAYREAVTRLSFREGAEYIINRYKLSKTPEELLAQINSMAMHEYRDNIKLKPGVFEYLQRLSKQKIPLVIGTSCTEELCRAVLESNKIIGFFQKLIFANKIPGGKRTPDFFRACAESMGLECGECTVFEDSAFAVHSAREAGCKTVGIYDDYSKDQFAALSEACDLTIHSFNELPNHCPGGADMVQ